MTEIQRDCELKLLSGKVVVRRIERGKEGEIYLPESAQRATNIAEVVAVGLGRKLKHGGRAEVDLQAGSTAVIPPRGGISVVYNGENLLLFAQAVILAIVDSQ